MVYEKIFADFLRGLIEYAPRILGAIVILIIGWAIGRLLGAAVSRVLDRAGVDDALRKTSIGRAIEKAGVPIPRVFDILIRVFVYLIAVFAAVNVLEIAILTHYMKLVVEYLPSLIGGIAILLFGLMIADFIGDAIAAVGREAKIEYAGLASLAVRGILYLVVIIVGLSTMRIDVTILNSIVTALAWGLAGALAIGGGIAVGFGLKDYVAKKADEWLKMASERARELEKKR